MIVCIMLATPVDCGPLSRAAAIAAAAVAEPLLQARRLTCSLQGGIFRVWL